MSIDRFNIEAPTLPSTVELPGGRLAYQLTGEGPVLCLVTTLSGVWSRQVRRLQRHFRVLVYDMRGFGQSISNTGMPSNEQHATDLELLIERLGLHDVTVVGLSHGGIVSQHLALRQPSSLARLVLVATLGKPIGPTRLFLQMLDGFLAQGRKEDFWQVLKFFLISERSFDRVMRHEALFRRVMFEQYTAEMLHDIYSGALKHDALDQLASVHVPTLVIGGREDMLFPPSITEALAAAIPGAELCYLNTAHVPPVEDPDGFETALLRFLQNAEVGVAPAS